MPEIVQNTAFMSSFLVPAGPTCEGRLTPRLADVLPSGCVFKWLQPDIGYAAVFSDVVESVEYLVAVKEQRRVSGEKRAQP